MTKYIGALIVLLAISFAFGRYSVSPEKIVTTDTKTLTNEVVHTVTKIVTVKVPTGGEQTTTTVDTTTQEKVDQSQKQAVVVEVPKHKMLNVSALASVDILHPEIPIYGASVSKEFVGPITLGIFGLTNGILGISIGINF